MLNRNGCLPAGGLVRAKVAVTCASPELAEVGVTVQLGEAAAAHWKTGRQVLLLGLELHPPALQPTKRAPGPGTACRVTGSRHFWSESEQWAREPPHSIPPPSTTPGPPTVTFTAAGPSIV